MKRICEKFDKLPAKRRMALVTAVVLTLALMISIPAYSWFNNQKKAAEMFKVKYPNSLYINAAHREDTMFFNLNTIDVNEKVSNTPVTEKYYVFSVSGSNTQRFYLQMAHTNNNYFTYEVYEASQYRYKNSASAPENTPASEIVPSGTTDDRIIEYQTHTNSHTEMGDFVITDDPNNDDASVTLYYVRGAQVTMDYKNPGENTPLADSNLTNKYYEENYKSNSTTLDNVDERDVASYWLSHDPVSAGDNINKENFCKYFVLKVTWPNRTNKSIEKKETDMLYLSVERA